MYVQRLSFLLPNDRFEAHAGRPRADPHHDVGVVDGAAALVDRAEGDRLVAQPLADVAEGLLVGARRDARVPSEWTSHWIL